MKKVRAKFYCKSINHIHNDSPEQVCAEVKLAPVYASGNEDDPNAVWSKYTPQGEVYMVITNPAAIDAFDLGKEYFVDFTPAG